MLAHLKLGPLDPPITYIDDNQMPKYKPLVKAIKRGDLKGVQSFLNDPGITILDDVGHRRFCVIKYEGAWTSFLTIACHHLGIFGMSTILGSTDRFLCIQKLLEKHPTIAQIPMSNGLYPLCNFVARIPDRLDGDKELILKVFRTFLNSGHSLYKTSMKNGILGSALPVSLIKNSGKSVAVRLFAETTAYLIGKQQQEIRNILEAMRFVPGLRIFPPGLLPMIASYISHPKLAIEDINKPSSSLYGGKSMLRLCVDNGDEDGVSFLVYFGANSDERDSVTGLSIRQIAREKDEAQGRTHETSLVKALSDVRLS